MQLIMPPGTRDMLRWMAEREAKARAMLTRRAAYGGRKGRRAARRLRAMGDPLWQDTERVVAGLWGPLYARPPYGIARETDP
jgi:hypothetical protein